MKRLDILFVSEYFYPRAAGGEVWAWELCRELTKRGHKVTVITCRHGHLREEETAEGVHIMRPVQTYHFRPIRRVATMLLARHVSRYLSTHKPDVIHVPAYTMNVPVSKMARERGIPCITAVHSFFGDDWRSISPFWHFLRWLERKVIIDDRSRTMHVPSRYLRKRIKEETGRDSAVIHNWLPERFPKPKRFAQPTLLFVGSLERVKNPLACIPVAKRLGMPLVVIGSGSLEEELLRDAGRAGIDCAVLPHATREQALAAIGGAAMVLVPSVTESFSLVALEAVAQGTPVSGNPVGILPELPGVTAWPPKRLPGRLPAAAQRQVRERFSLKRAADSVERMYRERR